MDEYYRKANLLCIAVSEMPDIGKYIEAVVINDNLYRHDKNPVTFKSTNRTDYKLYSFAQLRFFPVCLDGKVIKHNQEFSISNLFKLIFDRSKYLTYFQIC